MSEEQYVEKQLIPEGGIEKLVPGCEVCRGDIPMRRLSGRNAINTRHTCSARCETVRKQHMRWLSSTRMCLNCKHPSTPKEREEFKAWRKARGDVWPDGQPKPTYAKTRGRRTELYGGLTRAMEMLKEEAAFKPEVATFLEEMKIIVDGGEAGKRTLTPSGESAEVNEGDDNEHLG